MMKMQPVESSNIKAIGHDPDKNILHVQFHNGKTWRYSNVLPESFAEFMAADSKGSHFAKHIRTRYGCSPHEDAA